MLLFYHHTRPLCNPCTDLEKKAAGLPSLAAFAIDSQYLWYNNRPYTSHSAIYDRTSLPGTWPLESWNGSGDGDSTCGRSPLGENVAAMRVSHCHR